jgi:hypothetical protein
VNGIGWYALSGVSNTVWETSRAADPSFFNGAGQAFAGGIFTAPAAGYYYARSLDDAKIKMKKERKEKKWIRECRGFGADGV